MNSKQKTEEKFKQEEDQELRLFRRILETAERSQHSFETPHQVNYKLPNGIEFPSNPLLNLILFEYQEFIHQPPSLEFFSIKTEEDDEFENKYARVFNCICELVEEDLNDLKDQTVQTQTETDLLHVELEQIKVQTASLTELTGENEATERELKAIQDEIDQVQV